MPWRAAAFGRTWGGEATTLLMSLMAEYTNEAVVMVVAVVAEQCMMDYKRQPVKWYWASLSAMFVS
jgi:hypothetical protein